MKAWIARDAKGFAMFFDEPSFSKSCNTFLGKGRRMPYSYREAERLGIAIPAFGYKQPVELAATQLGDAVRGA